MSFVFILSSSATTGCLRVMYPQKIDGFWEFCRLLGGTCPANLLWCVYNPCSYAFRPVVIPSFAFQRCARESASYIRFMNMKVMQLKLLELDPHSCQLGKAIFRGLTKIVKNLLNIYLEQENIEHRDEFNVLVYVMRLIWKCQTLSQFTPEA